MTPKAHRSHHRRRCRRITNTMIVVLVLNLALFIAATLYTLLHP